MFADTLYWFQVIGASALHGDLFTQIAAALTSHSEERSNIVFALAMIGGTCGAGFWIGWELLRTVSHIFRSIGSATSQTKRGTARPQ